MNDLMICSVHKVTQDATNMNSPVWVSPMIGGSICGQPFHQGRCELVCSIVDIFFIDLAVHMLVGAAAACRRFDIDN